MATDFLALLHRDHQELDRGLSELLEPVASFAQLRGTLDGVRLGLTAHAEAEDIVLAHALRRCATALALAPLVAQARSAHLAQEGAFTSLVCAPPNTATWRARARELREAAREHAAYEEEVLVPAIREHGPDVYAPLAGAFATERLRQLAMLAPSAPIYAPHLAPS